MKFSAIALLAFASIIALSGGTSKEPDWEKIYSVCYKLLRVSPVARTLHGQDPNPESQCVTRCVGIMTGMYDDETGISIKQLESWRDDDDDDDAVFEEFKTKYQTCAAKIKPEHYGDDYCKKSSKHHECFV